MTEPRQPSPRARAARLTLAVACLAALPLAAQPPKVMFVTSSTGNGNFSSWSEAGGQTGLAAADKVCRARATAAGLANALTFVAWASNTSDDAYCRAAGFAGTKDLNCGQGTLPDGGPWVRTDGKPFARSLVDLANSSRLLYPATRGESGQVVTGWIWDATRESGVLLKSGITPIDCLEWTSANVGDFGGEGVTGNGTGWWSYFNTTNCSDVSHLLCFEPGTGGALAPFEQPGALAFVTSFDNVGNLHDWPQSGGASGLAAGDAICANLATAAGLPFPGLFRAWLSTAAVAAKDRLTIDGPWKRRDGVEIAATKAQLTSALTPGDYALTAPLDVSESGSYRASPTEAWTGTRSDGTDSAADCSGWTDGTAGSNGTGGRFLEPRGAWTEGTQWTCDADLPLYCLANIVTLFWDGFESSDISAWSTHSP